MKKSAFLLALCLFLSSCTVGPEESPRGALDSGDIPAQTLPPATAAPYTEEPPAEPDEPPVTEEAEQGGADRGGYDDGTSPDVTEASQTAASETEEGMTVINGEEVLTDPEYQGGTVYPVISLNVRSGPATSYERLGHVDEGQPCTALARTDDWEWYLIEFRDGFGWIGGAYVTEEPPADYTQEEPESSENGEEYPPIDGDVDVMNSLVAGYAETLGVSQEECALDAYFGEFGSGFVAVLRQIGDSEYAGYDGGEVEICGVKLLKYSGASKYFYIDGGKYIPLEDAYAEGLLNDGDMKKLKYYCDRQKDAHDEEYPPIDADVDALNRLIVGYAETLGAAPTECVLDAYFGEYGSGVVAVLRYWGDGAWLPEYVEYDGSETELCGVSLKKFSDESGYYYIEGGKYIPLEDAYAEGLVDDGDMRRLKYYCDLKSDSSRQRGEFYESTEPAGGSKPGRLSEEAEKKLIADYAKFKGTTEDNVGIGMYYGTFDGGEVVVMYLKENGFDNDTKQFCVAGYFFWAPGDSELEIAVHTPSGEFVGIAEAYRKGVLSERDLNDASYYNQGM